jgi:hypothetical protein
MRMTSGSTIGRALPKMGCPACGSILHPRPGAAIVPTTWRDCLRRCPDCELGLSNARINPTVLFNDPRMNVPPEVRGGVIEALALALNVRNRANKKVRFGFSTSEDALTWTVFSFLQGSGQLLEVLRRAGLPIPDGVSLPEALLLWGVPIPLDRVGDDRGWGLRDRLEKIADRLGESPRSRTEPDVVIDLGDLGVLIIEVKHRSGTDVKSSSYAGWDRYYPENSPFPHAASVRASGCYELARNWRFGLELAADPARHFTLVCLGPEGLFRGEGAEVLRPFESCLPRDESARFQRLTWGTLLGAVGQTPEWLVRYVRERGYSITTGGR